MQPGGHQQTDYDYDYQQYSQQPPSGGGASDVRPSVPSMRPTLEATSYYPHQGMLPSPQQQQYTPQHSFYQPSRTPVAISQFPYAESPLEHKPLSGYQSVLPTRPEPLPLERMCDVCQHPDPVLVAPNCNHTFHSRCVHVWPLGACPACSAPLEQVAISGSVNMMAQPAPRSGKWTRPEEIFIDGIIREFDRQALPLAHGTPIRLVLAKLLNCSTMRLSKKFQKNALGKRTFRVSKPARGDKAMEFDQMDHQRRQREFSRLEQAFRQELVDQFRRENNTDEGAMVETQNLRCAVQQFWVSNFLKFAVLVGQPVVGLDVSDAKKRKHALQLLRNGKYDELLSWSHHPSPANTASVTPIPSILSAPVEDLHASSGQWSTGAAVYSSTSLPSGPSIPTLLQQIDQRPAKKMRTPENTFEPSRFGMQPPPMDQAGAAFPHYGRLSPSQETASSFDYTQPQQEQQQYSSESYARPSTAGYSPYGEPKAEKSVIGYTGATQQQQTSSNLVDNEVMAHEQRSGFTPTTYQGAGYHTGVTGQSSPWDELLENVPASAANVNAGSAANDAGSYQTNDSMRSWSNNPHMM